MPVELNNPGYEQDTNIRCDFLISHAQNVIECCPELGVKLEGPLNYKEWNYEFERLLSQWDIAYRHYFDQKIVISGATCDEVRGYYVGAELENLRLMSRKIDLALRNVVLNNLKEDKLHFHATPDGNHDFHDLKVQVEKACLRDPLMTKVGALRSLARGHSSNEAANRNLRIYGIPDWKLEVVAGVINPNETDERLLRNLLKAVEEANLDEEFHLIKEIESNNVNVVRERINAVIDKLIALVKDKIGSEGSGTLSVGLQQDSSVLKHVRHRFLEEVLRQDVQSVTNCSQSSDSEVVICDFLWSTGMSCHTVNDASLLRDVREEHVQLYPPNSPLLRTKVGSMMVEFPGGLKVQLKNVAYQGSVRPTFSHFAGYEDGINLNWRGKTRDLYLENNGEFLCTSGPNLWTFKLKVERKYHLHPTLRILNLKELPALIHAIKDTSDEDDGIYPDQLPEALRIQRAQLRFHRKFGHPSIIQYQFIHKRDWISRNPPFSPDHCRACVLSKPMIDFPDAPDENSLLIEGPIESTHIGISEVFRAAYDGSRFMLTIVDDRTKYATVYLLRSKAGAIIKIVDYFLYCSKLFSTSCRTIVHDNDPELGPQISSYCRANCIDSVTSHSLSEGTIHIAERWQRIILDKASRLLTDAHVPTIFWPAAVRQAVNQINLCPMKTLVHNYPFRVWQEFTPTRIKRPKYAIFGSLVWYVTRTKRSDFGCYLGPSPDNSRQLILSHYLARIVEVDEFEERRHEFFFKSHGLDLLGTRTDVQRFEILKPLLKLPSTLPIDLESHEVGLPQKRSLLAELFNGWRERKNLRGSVKRRRDSS